MKSRLRLVVAVCSALVIVAGAAPGQAQSQAQQEGPAVGLRLVADGLTSPVALVSAGDGSGRLFIVDQVGLVRVLAADGTLLPEPFLDLRSEIVPLMPGFDERGLLGLTFHPDFASNGRFFVFYSAPLRPGARPASTRRAMYRSSRFPRRTRTEPIPPRSGSCSRSTSPSSTTTPARSFSARMTATCTSRSATAEEPTTSASAMSRTGTPPTRVATARTSRATCSATSSASTSTPEARTESPRTTRSQRSRDVSTGATRRGRTASATRTGCPST